MIQNTRLHQALWLCGGAALLLAACRSASPATPTTTSVVQATTTQPAAGATPLATRAPDTPTALPTDTASPPPTASATASVTVAPSPAATASSTAAPTQTARPTAPGSLTAAPTRPPITITPLGPPETASVYSTTSGPAGYSSSIKCQRAGASCTPVMPPGDVSFSMVLAGAAAAPWTHFVYYGLSVEKDGANVADMFMFVDAGWLRPGTVVGFGTSRNFNQPGTYVIRSSGCMTTDTKSNNCAWATMAGDVVTFVIQN